MAAGQRHAGFFELTSASITAPSLGRLFPDAAAARFASRESQAAVAGRTAAVIDFVPATGRPRGRFGVVTVGRQTGCCGGSRPRYGQFEFGVRRAETRSRSAITAGKDCRGRIASGSSRPERTGIRFRRAGISWWSFVLRYEMRLPHPDELSTLTNYFCAIVLFCLKFNTLQLTFSSSKCPKSENV